MRKLNLTFRQCFTQALSHQFCIAEIAHRVILQTTNGPSVPALLIRSSSKADTARMKVGMDAFTSAEKPAGGWPHPAANRSSAVWNFTQAGLSAMGPAMGPV